MNGSTENTTSGAFEKPGRRDAVLNLETAKRMLSLVRPIVDDFLESQRRLAEILPEQERLDRQRRTLTWPERRRRYQLQEEISAAQQRNKESLAELDGLGITMVEPAKGRVGFPTLVNDRRAFFSWQPGDESVTSWHFVEESVRRAIPSAWTNTPSKVKRGKT